MTDHDRNDDDLDAEPELVKDLDVDEDHIGDVRGGSGHSHLA